ncbi:OST-HTH/LOTUS domain-containing protein [Zoogloea sp.]|uniref:OST-HTH/LOTUS domain-containing protein n=1 Tax=Zoogloea sp. TaxID=49181 RepID=UPI0035B25DDE
MTSQALPSPAPSLADVQRKLGGCLLRLQQYEILLKDLVARSDVAAHPAQLQAVQDAQIASAHKKTLGGLVSMLTEQYLTVGEGEDSRNAPQGDDTVWVSMRFQLELDASQYQATTAALKELVALRNELVHHFLQRFNIWEPQDCIAADAYLDASYQRIDGHYQTLLGWAQNMQEVRKRVATYMNSDAFENLLLNGIAPDGTVHWPASGAVRCLREGEARFAIDGWTRLNSAITWLRTQYPEQQPQRYGCSSWRHIIHASQQFEICKRVNTEQGGREVWYRSRQE